MTSGINHIGELLGNEKPGICGAMAYIGDENLGIPIVENGFFFFIGSGFYNAQWVEARILKMMETNKPFGVNLLKHSKYIDDIVQIILKYSKHIKAVSLSGYVLPSKKDKELITALRSAGLVVVVLVGHPDAIQKWEHSGVDALILEGRGSGGHIGKHTTKKLLNLLLNEPISIPCIAAGGFHDYNSSRKALTMSGIIAIQYGSVFAACEESPADDKYKQEIVAAKKTITVGDKFGMGHEVRVLKTGFTQSFRELELMLERHFKKGMITASRKRSTLEAHYQGTLIDGMIKGNTWHGTLPIGKVVKHINKIKPAAQVIDELTGVLEPNLENTIEIPIAELEPA